MLIRSLRVAPFLVVSIVLSVGGCAKSGTAAKGQAAGGRSEKSFEAMRDPPIAAETRFAAGQLAEGRGALPQAAEQYRQAIKTDPKHLGALYRLGVVYAEMKRFDEAVEAWKKYAAATGDSAAAYSNLGFCYELARRPEDAEAAYLKGIRRDPKHVASRVNYGLMLVRRGRVNEGKLQLQTVLTEAEAHYNVGSVYESLGRTEQAKAEYDRALELDPSFADARARLDNLQKAPAPTATPASDVSKTR